MKRLIAIQQKLRSKKDKSGDNGRFKYRSAEDILEAVKPLLEEQQCAVILTDSLVESEKGEFFLRATAKLLCEHEYTTKDDNGQGIMYKDIKVIASTEGYALFDKHLTKSGYASMSNEQITGAASSYARKYALCGLFAIDDSDQDPDGMERPMTLAERIKTASSAEDINGLMEDVKKAEKNVKDSFLAKAKSLGLVFNKEQEKYIKS